MSQLINLTYSKTYNFLTFFSYVKNKMGSNELVISSIFGLSLVVVKLYAVTTFVYGDRGFTAQQTNLLLLYSHNLETNPSDLSAPQFIAGTTCLGTVFRVRRHGFHSYVRVIYLRSETTYTPD